MTSSRAAWSDDESPASIAIVGRGRLGTALSAALRHVGVIVRGPLGRGGSIADAQVVILCVPDAQIAPAASAVPSGRIVAHCSGATSLAPLAPHEGFSLHPLLSVLATTTSFAGAACAIDATSDRARAVANELAERLGMHAITVADEARPLYHAAASVAAGGIVTVAAFAEQLMSRAGVSRAALVPLVRSAIDNWAMLGADALTGPAVRGDEETIARQRIAVARAGEHALPFWDALTSATRGLVADAEREP